MKDSAAVIDLLKNKGYLENYGKSVDVFEELQEHQPEAIQYAKERVERLTRDQVAVICRVNLKQMVQTMNYLPEHNLLEYAVLEEKAAKATAYHNELSAQIKIAEKRMAEIAVLRTHVVNYAKTREIYVAYRKAGYSKKFRDEHEQEILLHQAAKKTYAEYRRSREEMRELLTAKANVDRLLKMEVDRDLEKEKTRASGKLVLVKSVRRHWTSWGCPLSADRSGTETAQPQKEFLCVLTQALLAVFLL